MFRLGSAKVTKFSNPASFLKKLRQKNLINQCTQRTSELPQVIRAAKIRIIPTPAKSLEKYLTSSRPALLKSKRSNTVFLNTRGNSLSRQSAWEVITGCAERSKIKAHVTPHAIRHSFATHLLDGGADIRVVQELLGHSSVTTTQIYTLVTIDKLRESYSSSHPRAK